jgi:hypothetical protein
MSLETAIASVSRNLSRARVSAPGSGSGNRPRRSFFRREHWANSVGTSDASSSSVTAELYSRGIKGRISPKGSGEV